MRLQEKIRADLREAMKAKDEEKKNALRVLIGEFGRSEAKELEDAEVVKIIRKMIKSAQETLERTGSDADSGYIEVLESYLPRTVSDNEIRQWISLNIDFSRYKNKMQAMRDIMAHFGDSAEGSRVKAILQEL
ncbi:MAG: GatB/YqeY domain-containing protein [Desulfosalsimonadaceae bacterium]